MAVIVVLALLAGGAVAWWIVMGRGEDDVPAPVAIGAVARDGSFEFVVSGMKCGARTAGGITAQGIYCVAGVRVTNRGTGAAHVDGAAQKVFDAGGTQYLSDTGADAKANEPAWSETLAPGATISGSLIFDVPAGTRPTELELHETLLSGGVRVRLS